MKFNVEKAAMSHLAASLCAVIAITSDRVDAQPAPLKMDVAVTVRNPAVAVPAGFTVFHGAKGIETPDFNFEQTLRTELLAALAADQRVQCQEVEGAPQAPAGDSDRLLFIDVQIIQAIKKIMEPTSFTMSGTILMVDRKGKEIWGERYSETVKAKGKMEEFVKDDQKGLKAALDKLIEHFVRKKSEKFRRLKNV